MKKILLFLSLVLTLTVFPVSAQNWYYVGQSPNDEQVFINNSAVMKNDVQAVVAIKTNPSRSGRKIDPDCQYDITIYTITRNYYYSIDGVYLYNDSQKLIRRQDKATAQKPIPAGSMLEKIYQMVW